MAGLLGLTAGASRAQQISFERYGQAQGLSNASTRCMLQDAAGFIWACSENGLFRFDGNRFERRGREHGLNEPDIRSIAFDPAERLWVATPGNLYRGGADGRFDAVRPGGEALHVTRPGQQMAFVQPDQALVVVADVPQRLSRTAADGAWRIAPFFSAEQVAAVPGLAAVSSVVAAPDGALWLGCGTQLCEWRDDALTVWGADRGVPASTWRDLRFDRTGALWARSTDAMAARPAGAARFERRDPPQAELSGALSYAPVAEDAQGRILTRTDSGLARWSDGRWQTFDVGNGLANGPVASLLVDREGALWLGRMGHGMDRWLGYGSWESWTGLQGIDSDVVWGMQRDAAGDLLVATNAGCRRLPVGAARAVDCGYAGLPRSQMMQIARADDGTLYFGVKSKYVYRVAPGTRTAEQIAVTTRLTRLIVDLQQRLWLVTDAGPRRIDPPPAGAPAGTPWTPRGPSQRGDDAVRDGVLGPRGELWFAARGALERIDGDRWTRLPIADERAAEGFDALAFAPDGLLWAGNDRGVARLRLDGERIADVQWMDAPLLRDLAIMFVRTDQRGWVWVGTDHGVVVYDQQRWRLADQTDGLVWNDINGGAFLADTDASVWLGSSGGLSHLLQPEQLQSTGRLQVALTSMRYGDSSLDAAGTSESPWRRDAALEVRLAALSPAWSDGARFLYRIVGLSEQWFETPNAEIRLPSLPPGRYRLEAVAVHSARGLASAPAALAFAVLAPWWRTPWFYLLCTLVGGLALALVWDWRARVQRRRQRELEGLLERATRDPLTGLWNRAAIMDLLSRAIVQARADGSPLAVALIDIDHFKRVNDTHGHLGGDEVLRTLCRELARSSRQGDALGRYGGEELLMVMPGLPRVLPSIPVERLRQQVQQIVCTHAGQLIPVTASFGVEWLSARAADADALIGRADAALYAAKSAGRDRVAYAGEASGQKEVV